MHPKCWNVRRRFSVQHGAKLSEPSNQILVIVVCLLALQTGQHITQGWRVPQASQEQQADHLNRSCYAVR